MPAATKNTASQVTDFGVAEDRSEDLAGYTVSFCANASNNPTTTADPTLIRSGSYEGLIALKTPYQLDITAKTIKAVA